jgi:hypothetical protein
VAQVMVCKLEALSSNSGPTKNKKIKYRQATGSEKLFVKYISNKELVSRICKGITTQKTLCNPVKDVGKLADSEGWLATQADGISI